MSQLNGPFFPSWFSGNGLPVPQLEPLSGYALQSEDLLPAKTQIEQDLGELAILTRVDREPKLFIGLDSVGAFVLKGISPNFIYDSDASSFLLLVNDRTATLGLDHLHRSVQLGATIAFYRSKNVSGKAL